MCMYNFIDSGKFNTVCLELYVSVTMYDRESNLYIEFYRTTNFTNSEN